MENCSNIKIQELKKENINVIFLDLRNSTDLNLNSNPQEIIPMYSEFLNTSYDILQKNGYKNIDIQGDGIYGVIESNKYQVIAKCMKELEDLILSMANQFGIKITMASFSGKEYFSCFGLKENKKKQIAFFNGLVSISKKIIANSSKKYILVINDKLKTELEQSKLFVSSKKQFHVKYNGGRDGEKYWVKKR